MSKVTCTNAFFRDENGKFHIRPLNLAELFGDNKSAEENSGRRTTLRRKFIPIEPMPMTLADFEIKPSEPKKTKKEKQVRKELFRAPPNRSERKFSLNRKPSIAPRTKVIKEESKDNSPLLDVDEAEELLNQNKLIPKAIKTNLFPNQRKDENTPPVTSTKKDQTPTSSSSANAELEFLQLEQACASAKKPMKKIEESPMTSVCNLLNNTKITINQDSKGNIVEKVLTLLNEDNDNFQEMKKQFQKFEVAHERRTEEIRNLLGQLIDNKENISRKSVRIASKSVKKFVISPAIGQNVDLRKSTLNKNLTKNLQCESPRTQKALTMYNSIRSDCAVLCTPKLERTDTDSVQASMTRTRSLSRRIQKQCLLLQDTPRP